MTQNGLKTQKNMFLSNFGPGPHLDHPLGPAGGAGDLAVFRPQRGFLGENCKYLRTGAELS